MGFSYITVDTTRMLAHTHTRSRIIERALTESNFIHIGIVICV